MPNQTLTARASAAIQTASAAMQPGDYAELEAIADEAASLQATTPAEALLQACMLAGEIDRDGNQERMAALAESLASYIEWQGGIARRDFGFEFYAGSGAQ